MQAVIEIILVIVIIILCVAIVVGLTAGIEHVGDYLNNLISVLPVGLAYAYTQKRI